jgi:hypothetical protein
MIDGVCQKISMRFSSAAEASVCKTTSFDTEQDSLDPNAADFWAQTHPTTNLPHKVDRGFIVQDYTDTEIIQFISSICPSTPFPMPLRASVTSPPSP